MAGRAGRCPEPHQGLCPLDPQQRLAFAIEICLEWGGGVTASDLGNPAECPLPTPNIYGSKGKPLLGVQGAKPLDGGSGATPPAGLP